MIKNQYRILTICLVSILSVLTGCKSAKTSVNESSEKNSEVKEEQPYVILVSLDGYRWDYVNKYKPTRLTNFINNGIQSESLIPSFPSKTFPNHYSIATGLYPDHHGIIENSFYSYKKDQTYTIGNRERVTDGEFYGGTPLWVLAEKSGMTSASYFYVGTEANIQGIKPTYYYEYDGKTPNAERVNQVINWLKLPEEERPHFITLYFSDLDDVGHKYGPSNEEKIKQAVLDLDKTLGDLFDGVAQTKLPVNIFIVSDHGMADLKTEQVLPLESILNDAAYKTVSNGSIVNIHPNTMSETNSIFETLKSKENHFKVYKTENTPGFEVTPKRKDWGTIQVVADYGYYFSSASGIDYRKANDIAVSGVHGYDPSYKEMHGIFYGNGPALKSGYTFDSFKNVHIYPLICDILGLEISDTIDGDFNVTKSVLEE